MTTQLGADEQRQKGRPAERVEEPAGGKSSEGLQLVCAALLRLLRLAAWTIVARLVQLIGSRRRHVDAAQSAECLPGCQLER